MKKTIIFLLMACFATTALLAQIVKTQSRTSSKIQVWKPECWAVTDWQNIWKNVQYDDNLYIKSKTMKGNLGAIMFFHLGFAIPTGATIEKIEATIIRFKNGNNTVTEQTVALLKHLNDNEACGGSPNMASSEPWTNTEKKMLYSFPVDGKDCNGQPFQWTPEEVNKSMFGLLLHPTISIGGKGSTAYIEQVTITIHYKEQVSSKKQAPPNNSLKTIVESIPKATMDIKQYGNWFRVNKRYPGNYTLMVFDNMGRLLQRTVLGNGDSEMVQLSTNCKGYCIITVEGNGNKTSQRVFVQ